MKSEIGIAWRPEIALLVEELKITFVEILAENFWDLKKLPAPLASLVDAGVTVVPHGISLSLGGADLPDKWRLEKLSRLAEITKAPYVSEHIAFVRGGGYESGHLLPVERTADMLEIVIENVRFAQANLSVPLVLENIATLSEWATDELTEAEFISRVVDATGVGLLLDVSNLFANCHNHKRSHDDFLNAIPLDKVRYVHVAGGTYWEHKYHDTHAHPLKDEALSVLRDLCQRACPPAIILERDHGFDNFDTIKEELNKIALATERSAVA